PAEGPVVEITRILTCERHSLRHALVDDIEADLRQAVDVALARAEIATFYCVVEEPVDAVTIVVIILGGVDSALGSDAVSAARGVLEAETLDLVAQLAQSRRG